MDMDLSHLSEKERESILQVIRRDEDLRRKEEQRLHRLKAELHWLRKRGALKSGFDPEHSCIRCRTELGKLLNRGAVCPGCQGRVCKSCRVQSPEDEEDWVCVVCHKQMEIQAASGEWMNEFIRRPSRRRDNKVFVPPSDVVKHSIRRSWTVGEGYHKSPEGSGSLREKLPFHQTSFKQSSSSQPLPKNPSPKQSVPKQPLPKSSSPSASSHSPFSSIHLQGNKATNGKRSTPCMSLTTGDVHVSSEMEPHPTIFNGKPSHSSEKISPIPVPSPRTSSTVPHTGNTPFPDSSPGKIDVDSASLGSSPQDVPRLTPSPRHSTPSPSPRDHRSIPSPVLPPETNNGTSSPSPSPRQRSSPLLRQATASECERTSTVDTNDPIFSHQSQYISHKEIIHRSGDVIDSGYDNQGSPRTSRSSEHSRQSSGFSTSHTDSRDPAADSVSGSDGSDSEDLETSGVVFHKVTLRKRKENTQRGNYLNDGTFISGPNPYGPSWGQKGGANSLPRAKTRTVHSICTPFYQYSVCGPNSWGGGRFSSNMSPVCLGSSLTLPCKTEWSQEMETFYKERQLLDWVKNKEWPFILRSVDGSRRTPTGSPIIKRIRRSQQKSLEKGRRLRSPDIFTGRENVSVPANEEKTTESDDNGKPKFSNEIPLKKGSKVSSSWEDIHDVSLEFEDDFPVIMRNFGNDGTSDIFFNITDKIIPEGDDYKLVFISSSSSKSSGLNSLNGSSEDVSDGRSSPQIPSPVVNSSEEMMVYIEDFDWDGDQKDNLIDKQCLALSKDDRNSKKVIVSDKHIAAEKNVAAINPVNKPDFPNSSTMAPSITYQEIVESLSPTHSVEEVETSDHIISVDNLNTYKVPSESGSDIKTKWNNKELEKPFETSSFIFSYPLESAELNSESKATTSFSSQNNPVDFVLKKNSNEHSYASCDGNVQQIYHDPNRFFNRSDSTRSSGERSIEELSCYDHVFPYSCDSTDPDLMEYKSILNEIYTFMSQSCKNNSVSASNCQETDGNNAFVNLHLKDWENENVPEKSNKVHNCSSTVCECKPSDSLEGDNHSKVLSLEKEEKCLQKHDSTGKNNLENDPHLSSSLNKENNSQNLDSENDNETKDWEYDVDSRELSSMTLQVNFSEVESQADTCSIDGNVEVQSVHCSVDDDTLSSITCLDDVILDSSLIDSGCETLPADNDHFTNSNLEFTSEKSYNHNNMPSPSDKNGIANVNSCLSLSESLILIDKPDAIENNHNQSDNNFTVKEIKQVDSQVKDKQCEYVNNSSNLSSIDPSKEEHLHLDSSKEDLEANLCDNKAVSEKSETPENEIAKNNDILSLEVIDYSQTRMINKKSGTEIEYNFYQSKEINIACRNEKDDSSLVEKAPFISLPSELSIVSETSNLGNESMEISPGKDAGNLVYYLAPQGTQSIYLVKSDSEKASTSGLETTLSSDKESEIGRECSLTETAVIVFSDENISSDERLESDTDSQDTVIEGETYKRMRQLAIQKKILEANEQLSLEENSCSLSSREQSALEQKVQQMEPVVDGLSELIRNKSPVSNFDEEAEQNSSEINSEKNRLTSLPEEADDKQPFLSVPISFSFIGDNQKHFMDELLDISAGNNATSLEMSSLLHSEDEPPLEKDSATDVNLTSSLVADDSKDSHYDKDVCTNLSVVKKDDDDDTSLSTISSDLKLGNVIGAPLEYACPSDNQPATGNSEVNEEHSLFPEIHSIPNVCQTTESLDSEEEISAKHATETRHSQCLMKYFDDMVQNLMKMALNEVIKISELLKESSSVSALELENKSLVGNDNETVSSDVPKQLLQINCKDPSDSSSLNLLPNNAYTLIVNTDSQLSDVHYTDGHNTVNTHQSESLSTHEHVDRNTCAQITESDSCKYEKFEDFASDMVTGDQEIVQKNKDCSVSNTCNICKDDLLVNDSHDTKSETESSNEINAEKEVNATQDISKGHTNESLDETLREKESSVVDVSHLQELIAQSRKISESASKHLDSAAFGNDTSILEKYFTQSLSSDDVQTKLGTKNSAGKSPGKLEEYFETLATTDENLNAEDEIFNSGKGSSTEVDSCSEDVSEQWEIDTSDKLDESIEESDTTFSDSASSDEASFDREEELRGFSRTIDFSLHTIIEESCEESESDRERRKKTETPQPADPSDLEKYFNFTIGDTTLPLVKRHSIAEESECSDSFSETSSSVCSEGLQQFGDDVDPAILASNRLEKYFMTGFLGLEHCSSFDDGNGTDESGSVGSCSECSSLTASASGSPFFERKLLSPVINDSQNKIIKFKNQGKKADKSMTTPYEEKEGISEEDANEVPFEKNDGFDTIKRKKKKKSDNLIASSETSCKTSLPMDKSLNEFPAFKNGEMKGNKEEADEFQANDTSSEKADLELGIPGEIVEGKNEILTEQENDSERMLSSLEVPSEKETSDCVVQETEEKADAKNSLNPSLEQDQKESIVEEKESESSLENITLFPHFQTNVETPLPDSIVVGTKTNNDITHLDKQIVCGLDRKQQSRDSGFIGSSDDLLKDSADTPDESLDDSLKFTSEADKEITNDGAKTNDTLLIEEFDKLSETPQVIKKKILRENSNSDDEAMYIVGQLMDQISKGFAMRLNGSPLLPRAKPPDLIAFETQLTKLMQTVPGVDVTVKEIVEELSSTDYYSDSYESSDYTSSDHEGPIRVSMLRRSLRSSLRSNEESRLHFNKEGATGLMVNQDCLGSQELQNLDSNVTLDPDDPLRNETNSPFTRETVYIYEKLMSSLNRMTEQASKENSDSEVPGNQSPSSTRSHPSTAVQVLQHIKERLTSLMREVHAGGDLSTTSKIRRNNSSSSSSSWLGAHHHHHLPLESQTNIHKNEPLDTGKTYMGSLHADITRWLAKQPFNSSDEQSVSSTSSTNYESEDSPTDTEMSIDSDDFTNSPSFPHKDKKPLPSNLTLDRNGSDITIVDDDLSFRSLDTPETLFATHKIGEEVNPFGMENKGKQLIESSLHCLKTLQDRGVMDLQYFVTQGNNNEYEVWQSLVIDEEKFKADSLASVPGSKGLENENRPLSRTRHLLDSLKSSSSDTLQCISEEDLDSKPSSSRTSIIGSSTNIWSSQSSLADKRGSLETLGCMSDRYSQSPLPHIPNENEGYRHPLSTSPKDGVFFRKPSGLVTVDIPLQDKETKTKIDVQSSTKSKHHSSFCTEILNSGEILRSKEKVDFHSSFHLYVDKKELDTNSKPTARAMSADPLPQDCDWSSPRPFITCNKINITKQNQSLPFSAVARMRPKAMIMSDNQLDKQLVLQNRYSTLTKSGPISVSPLSLSDDNVDPSRPKASTLPRIGADVHANISFLHNNHGNDKTNTPPPTAVPSQLKWSRNHQGDLQNRKEIRSWPAEDTSVSIEPSSQVKSATGKRPLKAGIGNTFEGKTISIPQISISDITELNPSGRSSYGSHGTSSDRESVPEEDIDRIVALHKTRSSLSSFGTRSDSMTSVYSAAGGGRYGTVVVRGEVQFGLSYNYKAGALEITIKRCRDLAAVDMKRNRSDPYVKIYLLPDKSKSGKRKTKVKKHTLNPTFEETLKYSVTISELETRTLWLTVWHSDMFGRNDFLGEVMLPLGYDVFGDPSPKWYPLQERLGPPEEFITYKGELNLSLTYMPPDVTTQKKGKQGKGSLHVLVKDARNLTAVRANGTSDPFCKSYLLPDKGKASKQKTPVIKKNCNPKWNHTFVYEDVSIDDLRERCLELTIWDYDRLTSNDFLGGVRLSLGTGKYHGKEVDWLDSSGEEISLWHNMLERPNTWVEGTLLLQPSMEKRA